VGQHPVQQPGLERQPAQLVDEVVGVGSGDDVVRRPHAGVPRVRATRDHRVPVDGSSRRGRDLLRDRAEEVDPPPVVLPRPPLELPHQGLGPAGHPAQALLDLAPVGEGVQPFGAGAQLAGRLRTPEQQDGQECPLVRLEPEVLVEDLVVLQRPTPRVRPHDPQQPLLLQRPRGLHHGLLVVVDDGLPAAALVAGGPQRVGAEGVRRRHGGLLLQQAAEDALLFGFQDRELRHPADCRCQAPPRTPM